MQAKIIIPVYELRPLPNEFKGVFFRYADGNWIPDDGEWDLAFVGRSKEGFPLNLYFQVPYHPNIICSWVTNSWTAREPKHRDENPWHYALSHGKTWGASYSDDNHPNTKAENSGHNKGCQLYSCLNGCPIEFYLEEPHIKSGLLRERDTKKVFKWPDNMKCMYCGGVPETQSIK